MRVTARLRTDEAGFTLVELLVVILLLGVVGGIMTSGMASAFRANAHAETRIQALTAMHATMAHVSRDVRAADSRDVGGAALRSASPTALELDIFRGGKRIRLTYTVTAGVLTERRRVFDNPVAAVASGPPSSDSTKVLMRDIVGATGADARPPFAYRTAAGACISGCSGNLATPVASSALRDVSVVAIRLRRSVGAGRAPLEVTTRVTLRNG